MKVINVTVEAS